MYIIFNIIILIFSTISVVGVVDEGAQATSEGEPPPPANESTSPSSKRDADAFTGSMADRIMLNDGHTIPVVGLGVALTAEATYNAVQWAMSVGYRLIDTAAEESYGNEDSVGQAIREHGTNAIAANTTLPTTTATTIDSNSENINIKRNDMFVTTKLWDSDHGFYATLESFDESYDTLDIGTIDLYLMHSPFGGRLVETWDAMLYVQSLGYVKSIGVSNFGVDHLQAIANSGRPLPAVNQIEMHPLVYRHRTSLIQWCRENNIQIQAYGSVMHGYQDLLNIDPLIDMTSRYQKTSAQILLRWALQHGFLIIPKSVRQERIIENSELYDFTLSETDMTTLDSLGDDVEWNRRNIYKTDWNWNPIDEAPIHLGQTHFWPDYVGVKEFYFGEDAEL